MNCIVQFYKQKRTALQEEGWTRYML